ncbi:MAG: hypothetical protein KDD53_07110, partial [Bdellovibrionales bacterium]|nr:hypothetical protein [Bdellovibrionales bacterium]
VVTQAALMTVVHILKITTFMVLGSYFHDYLVLIVAMVLATAIGSLVGTRLREIVSESLFKSVFKIVLTALAIRLIYSTDWSLVQ